MFTIELNEQERGCLLELLESSQKEKIHELHHARSSDYKQLLKHRIQVLEGLAAKMLATEPAL
jgi:hypothetical protein